MKFAKAVTLILSLTLASLVLTPQARAIETQSVGGFSWKAAHDFVLSCAVQPYAVKRSGEKVFAVLRSICPELNVTGGYARFELEGVKFSARVFDSAYSDGGDLNDIEVRTESGEIVAHATHLPSFGDVILALAGGDDAFRLVYDESLLAADLAD